MLLTKTYFDIDETGWWNEILSLNDYTCKSIAPGTGMNNSLLFRFAIIRLPGFCYTAALQTVRETPCTYSVTEEIKISFLGIYFETHL